MNKTKRRISTQNLVKIAVLAGLATILQMISISSGALLLPPWMKFDLADVPVLIAGFAMGPLPAVAVALIKNLLGLLTTSTAGVGELANFLICIAFVLPSSILYSKKPTKKSAMIGMGIGIVLMCIVGVILNYFVLMPLFIRLMFGSPEAFFQVAQGANHIFSSFWNICIFGVIPFNILKGLLESIVCLLIYKPLSRFFQK